MDTNRKNTYMNLYNEHYGIETDDKKRGERLEELSKDFNSIDYRPKSTDSDFNNFKTRIKSPHRHNHKKYIPIKVAAIAVALSMAVSSVGYAIASKFSNRSSDKALTLSESLAKGETAKTLGINNDLITELGEIKEMINSGEITNEEIIQMAPRLNELCDDALKTKLSNILGVNKSSIQYYSYNERGQKVDKVVVDSKIYIRDFLDKKFPKEISNVIEDSYITEYNMAKIHTGNFDRNKTLKDYDSIINDLDIFMGSRFEIDEEGKISLAENREINQVEFNEEQATPDEER